MASDFLSVLKEIRDTGAPEAEYTDGIYHDIVENTTDAGATTATTQAGIATIKAGEAAASATNAATSASNSQLRSWEAEAQRMTADSYATEAEDIVVKVWTSEGDGTFTSTDTLEYSALHYSAKTAADVISTAAGSDINIDGGRADSIYTANQIVTGGNA